MQLSHLLTGAAIAGIVTAQSINIPVEHSTAHYSLAPSAPAGAMSSNAMATGSASGTATDIGSASGTATGTDSASATSGANTNADAAASSSGAPASTAATTGGAPIITAGPIVVGAAVALAGLAL